MQTKRTRFLKLCAFLLLLGSVSLLFAGDRPAVAAFPRPPSATPGHGMVVSDTPAASVAGAEILQRGGNAIDAAVATALALGVASPASSGLGGGGFLVYYRRQEQRAYVLDFREVAPALSTPGMFLKDGHLVAELSRLGGLAVAVPGEPAGLAEAERRFGKLGLKEAVKPAIRLAQNGTATTRNLQMAVHLVLSGLSIAPDNPLYPLLYTDGKPRLEGDLLRRPQLAHSLTLLGQYGADPFYRGEIAKSWVESVAKSGGILSTADLAAYKPLWREALVGHFRGREVYTVPPPAGGLTLVEVLQILDAKPPLSNLEIGAAAAYHLLAEAFKHAFADRARLLGDPAFVKAPTERLASVDYAKTLAAQIGDNTKSPITYGGKESSNIDPPHDHGTSHLCVVDGEGNVVALTSTINLYFGSGVVDAKSGIVLNNQMDDFAAEPGTPNAFGLIGGLANAIAPGKRPLSSMSPTVVVKDGLPELCAGASGGPTIVTATAQVIVNSLDYQLDAAAATSAARVHAQWLPETLAVENWVPKDVVDALQRRGHKTTREITLGVSQVLQIRPDRLEGGADPRKGGSAATY